MTGLARRMACLLVVVLTCALLPSGAQAADVRPKDNVATAIAQDEDGSRAFDLAWEVRKQDGGGVVDNLNGAYATARDCTGCHAAAIAFQVVLVSGSPTTYSPRNEAVAQNITCPECEAFAQAAQFVRVFDAPVKITDAGRAELADVHSDLRTLAAQDLSPFQLLAAVELQEARVTSVLDDEVVLKSDPDTEADVLDQRLVEAADIG
jgi:hypothetical protein